MDKKIIIAGGTGFVGKYLSQKYKAIGYNVIIISRQKKHINWDDQSAIVTALENSTMLINLAGKSVDCRYNKKNKKTIFNSRTDTTKMLGNAILNCKIPPVLWINSSTATIYRHAEDRPMTESTGEIGSGFSVNVATNWEKAFFEFNLSATRQVALRMAIVLGKDGGVIQPLKNLVRFGMGGKQGKGNQMFSWIHIEDVFSIVEFTRQLDEVNGVLNTAAPNPVTNKMLMQLLRNNMNVKIGLPIPKWLLEIGAIIIKTETELILKSRWVVPERLSEAGFQFKYPDLNKALKNILKD
ncbi:MAG: TIGR01777 family oxidoreductase [Ferruginibacter sp.]